MSQSDSNNFLKEVILFLKISTPFLFLATTPSHFLCTLTSPKCFLGLLLSSLYLQALSWIFCSTGVFMIHTETNSVTQKLTLRRACCAPLGDILSTWSPRHITVTRFWPFFPFLLRCPSVIYLRLCSPLSILIHSLLTSANF